MSQVVTRSIMPFVAVTSGFAWMSAAAHLLVLLCFKTYIADLRRGINRFRWYEYAFSSSLMIWLIAMLFGERGRRGQRRLRTGNNARALTATPSRRPPSLPPRAGMYDIVSLTLLAGVNACMNLFGYLQESTNLGRLARGERIDWTPFVFGCFAGALPWACLFTYLGGAGDANSVPGFVCVAGLGSVRVTAATVSSANPTPNTLPCLQNLPKRFPCAPTPSNACSWAILFCYFVCFNSFPIGMIGAYARLGWFSDAYWKSFAGAGYYHSERSYQVQRCAPRGSAAGACRRASRQRQWLYRSLPHSSAPPPSRHHFQPRLQEPAAVAGRGRRQPAQPVHAQRVSSRPPTGPSVRWRRLR